MTLKKKKALFIGLCTKVIIKIPGKSTFPQEAQGQHGEPTTLSFYLHQ